MMLQLVGTRDRERGRELLYNLPALRASMETEG